MIYLVSTLYLIAFLIKAKRYHDTQVGDLPSWDKVCNRPHPQLELCCLIHPAIFQEEPIDYSRCVFCEQQVCQDCRHDFINDGFYHHKQCLIRCPHGEKYHKPTWALKGESR